MAKGGGEANERRTGEYKKKGVGGLYGRVKSTAGAKELEDPEKKISKEKGKVTLAPKFAWGSIRPWFHRGKEIYQRSYGRELPSTLGVSKDESDML